MIVIDFVLLDSINITTVNKNLKKTLELKLSWTKTDIRNDLATTWISSFHGWNLGYSDQFIWSLSSCLPLFCPIKKIRLSRLGHGTLWDKSIPDVGSSSWLHRREKYLRFLSAGELNTWMHCYLHEVKQQKVIDFNTLEVLSDHGGRCSFTCQVHLSLDLC